MSDKAAVPAAVKADEKEKEKKPELTPEQEAAALVLADVKSHIALINKSLNTQESRYIARVLRSLSPLRKRLTRSVLLQVITAYWGAGDESNKARLLDFLSSGAAVPMDDVATPVNPQAASRELAPEVELYLHLLVLIFLLDDNKVSVAVQCAEALIKRAVETKRRTSDQISARGYFYYALAHERSGSASLIRSTLHAALRTATLRCDEIGQSVITNLLLRNYLNDDLIDQADRLVSKSVFPESAPNSEGARYQFYLGRIRAVQLDYSEADLQLTQALRKASNVASGFIQTATKFSVIVKMLMGEIPERSTFHQPHLKRSLEPYLALTHAVRLGDLGGFNRVVTQYSDKFQLDKTFTLILRLRHNVIKTGVRIISLSYARISLEEIAQKLQLDSAEDAEYIVAKAIRDGVIDATIDREGRFLKTNELIDVYRTGEPQDAFHQRIAFCLKLHNDSVKAMRYPPNAYRKYLEGRGQVAEADEVDIAEMAEEEGDEF